MPVNVPKLVESRLNEPEIIAIRDQYVSSGGLQEWHKRLSDLDNLYKGNFKIAFPNEEYEQELPNVMNLIQTGIEDIARLVSEGTPAVTINPRGDDQKAKDKAYTQEAAIETYWEYSNGDLLVPRLAMDVVGAGAAFVAVDAGYKDGLYTEEYPCLHRIDPRYAYPDFYNGKLISLLVVQTHRKRVAQRLFPRLAEWLNVGDEIADEVEIVQFYSEKECVQALVLTKGGRSVPGGAYITQRWEPDLGMVPVGFAQLDTFDGELRGMFDQIAGSLNTENRIIRLLLDYTDRLTYASLVSKGLLNPQEKEGPEAHFRLDPNAQDARVERLAPAGPAPQLFNLLEILERGQRGGISYPAQRQGEVNQSIASASFVNSTMGQLTTSVRNIQRLLGNLREDLAKICIAIDTSKLDNEKALCRSVNDTSVYTPSKLFAQKVRPKVNYGAGAGLDRLNADVRVLQHLGAGLISKEAAREQIDYLKRDSEEADRIEKETAQIALTQKFLGEAPWDLVAKVIEKMEKGIGLQAAITEVMKENPEGGAGAEASGAPPGPTPQGQTPGTEQLALQKGGQPAAAPSVEFPKEPLANILIHGGTK